MTPMTPMTPMTSSAPVSEAAGPAPAPAGRWRRRRSGLVVGLVLLVALAVVVAVGTGTRTEDPLDPDNPGPDGAQAVARVLADRGVEVRVARGAQALADLDVGPEATVLVVNPGDLGADALADLADRFVDQELWVAGAGPGAVQALGSTSLPTRVDVTDALAAGCEDPLLGGLEIQVDRAYAYPGGAGACFTGAEGRALVTSTAGVRLLGADQALTNDQVLRADNAALALRILGQGDELVWFVPSLTDLTGADGVSLASLLPRWIQPALGLGLLVLLSTMLWRGRRLGSLSTEPLPVVVRAVETTHSLGRLYRRSGDRAHAATTLRRAAVRRAARHLKLGRRVGTEDPDAVAYAVARHLGRGTDDVRTLLSPHSPAPTDDTELITLATDLAELDREVRRP